MVLKLLHARLMWKNITTSNLNHEIGPQQGRSFHLTEKLQIKNHVWEFVTLECVCEQQQIAVRKPGCAMADTPANIFIMVMHTD